MFDYSIKAIYVKFGLKKTMWVSILAILVAGFLLPANQIIPVAGASKVDWVGWGTVRFQKVYRLRR